jgi:integration host factor subunit beta
MKSGGNMTKSELNAVISGKCNTMTKKQVEFVVNNVFSSIKEALANYEKVEIRGFVIFRVRHKPSKEVRNPKTGERIMIDEYGVPSFRPGKEIKEELLKK